jgi:hypothetical protein
MCDLVGYIGSLLSLFEQIFYEYLPSVGVYISIFDSLHIHIPIKYIYCGIFLNSLFEIL